jgi:hypothetical protein
MTIKQQMENALNALGHTPDQVGDALKKLGITGKKMDVCHCPIANYLNQKFPQCKGSISVGIRTAGDNNGGRDAQAEVPVVVQTFISRFDDGGFPDLLEQV